MDAFRQFTERFPTLETERDFSFAMHTCIGSGGKAALAVSPSNTEEAAECLNFLERNGIPHCFLGAGANVLPRDGRYEGVVVRFNRMKKLVLGERLYAGAGVTGGELLAFAEKNSVTGFEPFAGIPTTVGGGVAMNAGIAERHFSDLVISVTAYKDGIVTVSYTHHLEHETEAD
ncbi:MAG: FAD-binding protein, partial [Clostridia bacterium]|nr:FAD-binding protein [Clostridia bacterium]